VIYGFIFVPSTMTTSVPLLAQKRLQKEMTALAREPPQFIRARPEEDDILSFHYVVEGPPKTDYAGGYYHGVLKFPTEYPLKSVDFVSGAGDLV
jgi:ubiquitin-protein ligase